MFGIKKKKDEKLESLQDERYDAILKFCETQHTLNLEVLELLKDFHKRLNELENKETTKM